MLEVLTLVEQAHVLAAMGRDGEAGAAVARARTIVGDGRHWGNVGDRVATPTPSASSAAGRFADADVRFQRALDGVRTVRRPVGRGGRARRLGSLAARPG